MPTRLEFAILGYKEDEQLALLQSSDFMPAMDAARYRQLVSIEPILAENEGTAPALALLSYEADSRLLACALQPAQPDGHPAYLYALIPNERLCARTIGLERILAGLPEEAAAAAKLDSAGIEPTDFEGPAARVDRFGELLGGMLETEFEHVMTLLGAMLHERRLLIRNFPRDYAQRLQLLAGIRALMPCATAAILTFSTTTLQSSLETPHLIFADDRDAATQWVFDWERPNHLTSLTEHVYLDLLRRFWQGDLADFAAHIDRLEPLAGQKWRPDLNEALSRLALRHDLNALVLSDGDVATGDMIEAVTSTAPPEGELRFRYITKLLANALQYRDVQAGKQVAEELARDETLAEKLEGMFNNMLDEQPDTVYVFVRNRLQHLGIDDRWVARLQVAAADSLEVAIQAGDIPTLISWLELIAHEPLTYQLRDVLRQGVLDSLPRARENGELAVHLILIAVRRLPDIVDQLYEDEALIKALPEKLSRALDGASAETLEALLDENAEYFLLALFHGVQTSEQQFITAKSTAHLWSLYESDLRISLPAVYRPQSIIHTLAGQSSHQLSEDALDLLLTRVMGAGDRDLLVEMVGHLADRDQLFPRLNTLLESDIHSIERVIWILNVVSHTDNVSLRDVVDTYFLLLDYFEWQPEAQPMMEALARLMGKGQALQLSYRHLWKQFENCNTLQLENAARTSIVQLLHQFGKEDDPALVVQGLARITRQCNWSKTLLATLNSWWRDYTHSRSLTQLNTLDREMETQRHLEPQRQILKTVLAMRRWMHNRDASTFAAAIDTAFSIMDHIAEAFDSGHMPEIDPQTLRRELDAFGASLSADERHILANNLRNLAHRITDMAERRSKPSLIRSDDSIERQLTRGEANPQGSIDMMKWIAGYLDGAHQQRAK